MPRNCTTQSGCRDRTLTLRPRTARLKRRLWQGACGWLDWRFSTSSQSALLALSPETRTISKPRAPSLGSAKALPAMTMQDDDFNPRPGRIRHGNRVAKRPKSFVGEVMRAAKKAGHRGRAFGQRGRAGGGSTFGRGRRAALCLASRSPSRRVVVMARIVRHRGGRFRSAPLSKHVAYLKREGVTATAPTPVCSIRLPTTPTPRPSPNGV